MKRQEQEKSWVGRVVGSLFWGIALLGMLLVSLPAAAAIFVYGLFSYWRSAGQRKAPADITPDVVAQTRQLAAFPTAATLVDRALGRAATGGGPLAAQVLAGLRIPLVELTETELPSVPAQDGRTSDEAHRALLLKHVAKISSPTYLGDLEGFLTRLAQAILASLHPQAAAWSLVGWPEELQQRSLLELMPDPPGVVATIVDRLLNDTPTGQFLMLKSILAANIGIAGDVLPRDYAGSREALVQAYLYGTPFFEFLHLHLSRQQLAA